MFRKHGLVLFALATAMGVSSTLSAAEPEDQIKYRQNTMKALGGHTGSAFALVGGKVEHPDHLLPHAQGLAAMGGLIKDLFPEGSGEGKTAAKAEIWENPDDFGQKVEAAEQAAAAFLAAVESGDQEQIGASLKEVGQACKGCHDEYRQKD